MATSANPSSATSELDRWRIQDAPPDMYYIPDFLSREEEAAILEKIPPNRWITLTHRRLQAHPAPLSPGSNTLLATNPHLPAWLAEPILPRLRGLGIFGDAPHGAANHCLINEYRPGQGIMPHEDGAAYHPVVATVSLGASLVLDVRRKAGEVLTDDGDDGKGSAGEDVNPARSATTTTTSSPTSWRILQEPRSLLVTTGAAYTDVLHGIADVQEDRDLSPATVANWSLLGDAQSVVDNGGVNRRETRISLTFRDVKKVSRLTGKIFGGRR